MSTILFHKEDNVGYISLNRPEKYNSFNREMAMQLQQALQQCAADEEIRCVYLTGTGKGFCAGQDLAEATDPAGIDFAKVVAEHYNPIIHAMRNMPKPVIAAVNGVAAGAGANIALAADIVVANESASFVQAFSKIGLVPDSGGTFFLPRLVGIQRAAALMMTAEKVSAADAVAMGMIYKYYPDYAFEEESKKMAKMLAQMPTEGLALTKQLLNKSFDHDLQQQLDMEMNLQVTAGHTADFKEGVQAFLEKRKPVFTGK